MWSVIIWRLLLYSRSVPVNVWTQFLYTLYIILLEAPPPLYLLICVFLVYRWLICVIKSVKNSPALNFLPVKVKVKVCLRSYQPFIIIQFFVVIFCHWTYMCLSLFQVMHPVQHTCWQQSGDFCSVRKKQWPFVLTF